MLEIYFKNLNKETQKEVLKFYGYKKESDGNWEFTPLFILAREWEKDWTTVGGVFDKLRQSRAKD